MNVSQTSNDYGTPASLLKGMNFTSPQFHGASPTTFQIGNSLYQMISKKPQENLKQEMSWSSLEETSNSSGSGYTSLHVAAAMGQSLTTYGLLENLSDLSDINARDHNGNTPLMWAASEGYEEIVQMLIDNGAEVNLQNYKGETALFLAASRGFSEIVASLIKNGANVNLSNVDEATPFHAATACGYLDVMSNLARHGAFVNMQDIEGDSPLHYAVRESDMKVVEFLVKECRAEVNIKNEDQETPLELASCLNETKMVEFLSQFNREEVEHEGTFLMSF